MSNQNKTKDDKKKIRKARFAFFVIPNAILVIICAILGYAKWQELKSHWPLFAISGIIILLILNRICYSLYKAREDRKLTRLDPEVSADQVKSSLKLLRYAAAALAVISFITTAQGLKSFVFPEEGQEWQAYTASFAVQSILLVFNFLFFPFYVRIKKPERFPAFFQHILIYCIVFLFIGSLIVSSTFSYVFIANNTYKDMRPKNSNITIEKFLTEEAYNLSRVNDEIGEKLRKKIVYKADELRRSIESQNTTTAVSNDSKVERKLLQYSLSQYNQTNESFYPDDALNRDIAAGENPEHELREMKRAFDDKKESYDTIFGDTYKTAFTFYEQWNLAEQKRNFTNYREIEGKSKALQEAIGLIDDALNGLKPGEFRAQHLVRDISQYRTRAVSAFEALKNNIVTLKGFYDEMLIVYGEIDQSTDIGTRNELEIKSILNFVYNNEYDPAEAEVILDSLSELQEGMLASNAAEAGQPGNTIEPRSTSQPRSTIEPRSTSQPSNTSESDNPHKELHDFTEAFNSFVKYAELKDRIKRFIDNNLSITYYIKSEGESDELAPDEQSPAPETTTPAPSGEGGHTYKTVSKAEWTKRRKQDFVVFISCLKALPDLGQYKEKEEASVKNEEDASALMNDYDQQAVLEEAYTLNRDLLENISNFEKAINYFKYDFRLMAVLSAIMALFMDLASFLTGGFMFGASFFDELKKQNKQNKQNKQQTP